MGLGGRFHVVLSRLLVASVFLLSVGIVAWFSLVYTVHLGTVAVPELRGTTLEEADRMAHDIGLVMVLDDAGVFSDSIPVDHIAFQKPLPGFHLKAGSSVHTRLSLGGEQNLVPDLYGSSLQAAIRSLEASGLRPGRRAEVAGESESDSLVATSPAVGFGTAPGAEVDLLMNKSPAQGLWVMPSLISLPISAVRHFAQTNRFRLGRVHEVEYPGLGPGLVLRQYPPAGSPLSRSDIITLWISQ